MLFKNNRRRIICAPVGLNKPLEWWSGTYFEGDAAAVGENGSHSG